MSYEDFFIESEIYGVQSSSKVDYDQIYQHDFYGGVFQVTAKGMSTGYYGVTYKRNTPKSEYLNHVGVTLAKYSNIEIYVNPKGTNMEISNIVKVGESKETLSPGYHRIKIDPIELVSDEFAIVVKQYNANSDFCFQVEARVNGTSFGNVDTSDRSYFSVNGNTWQKLSTLGVSGIDMTTADVCIKGFTTEGREIPPEEPDEPVTPPVEEPDEPITPPAEEPDEPVTPPAEEPDEPVTPPVEEPDEPVTPPVQEPDEPTVPPVEEDKFSSTKYTIKESYILNITEETSKSEFIKNISTNLEMKFFTEEDKEVTNNDELIKTGMKLKLSNGKTYNLIIRGDINKDGKVTLTDISKLIFHYNESKGYN